MRTSYQEKSYIKNRIENSLKAFKMPKKTFIVRCLIKGRMKIFNSLNPSFVKDDNFWKTFKPFFSNKGDHGSNTQLVEGNKLLQDDQKIADELNTFFKKAVSNLLQIKACI